MPISSFPNGFSNGLIVSNIPLVTTPPGKVIWVNNSATLAPGAKPGSDNSPGTYRLPKATIAGALAQASNPAVSGGTGANTSVPKRGDIIMIMPNHAETVIAAAGINVNVQGIEIIGVANGDIRPTITSGTAAAASVKVSSNDCVIKNLIFSCGIANQTKMLDVAAKNLVLEDCRFAEGSQKPLKVINIGTAANDSDRFQAYRCEFYNPTANATDCIYFNKNQNSVRLRELKIHGDYSNGAVTIASTGNAQVDFQLQDSYIKNLNASGYCFIGNGTGNTGALINNSFINATRTNFSYGGLAIMGVYWSDGSGSYSSVPVVDANTVGAGALSGSQFYLTKPVTSSTVVTAGVNILTASGGDILIDGFALQTDGTGLAGGTNFTLSTDNVSGTGTFYAETVANLGANVASGAGRGSVTLGTPVRIESGKHVVAKCTGSNCTGAGVITITLLGIRGADGASMA